ncbi:MAG: AAA family ATPase [Acidimicrobiales bacterium]
MTTFPPAGDPVPPVEPSVAPPLTDTPPRAHGRVLMEEIRAEVGKVVVGQQGVLGGFLAALLADGHILLEGVPGVAKTLLVKTLAATLDIEMGRIQFTPDLMPSDVSGQLMYEQHTSSFNFRKGPVFTNLLLADEVNRTPPKTQAALLEVMEERQVTVGSESHPLPDPFMVIATQNPIEYEGTYPLPEAQLDRFIAKINVAYPERDNEQEILARHNRGMNPHDLSSSGVRAVASPAALHEARASVRNVRVEDSVLGYITELVRATRTSPVVDLGVSPRGGIALLGLAKSWAWMGGRDFVTPDDVKMVTKPGLRHRMHVQPEAELEGVTPDIVLDGLLDSVPVPR